MDNTTKSKLIFYIHQAGIKKDYGDLDQLDKNNIKAIFLEDDIAEFMCESVALAVDSEKMSSIIMAYRFANDDYAFIGMHMCKAIDAYLTKIDFIGQVNELIKECNE